MSSTDNWVGNFLISEIEYFEQFILLGIFFTIVSGLYIFSSKASAIVNVLKTEPYSNNPFVILFV